MRLSYHPDAEAELLDAVAFYEERVRGLGDQFLHESKLAVSELAGSPERWPIVEADIRRRIMRRFPFAIYFRVLESEIRRLVVKHHSRHPDYWRYRLDSS